MEHSDTISGKMYRYLVKCYEAAPGKWIESGFLEQQVAEYSKNNPHKKFKPSTAARKLRDLAREGYIEGDGIPTKRKYRFYPNPHQYLNTLIKDFGFVDRGTFIYEE